MGRRRPSISLSREWSGAFVVCNEVEIDCSIKGVGVVF